MFHLFDQPFWKDRDQELLVSQELHDLLHDKHSSFDYIAKRVVALKEELKVLMLLFHDQLKVLAQVFKTEFR